MEQRKIDGIALSHHANWREGVYAYQRRGQLSPAVGKIASLFAGNSKVHLANPDNPAERRVIDHVIDACEFRRIANIPPIAIADTQMVNAASVGGQLIVFTTGIMKAMPDHELRAVAGHEIAHHRHVARDMTVMGIIGAAIHGILHYCNLHTTEPYERAFHKAGLLGKLASHVVSPLAYVAMVTAAMTPWRWHMERESDREGADFMGAKTMGDALSRLHAVHAKPETAHSQGPKSVSHYCIDAIQKLLRVVFFPFSSHPPIESRVAEMRERQLREQVPDFSIDSALQPEFQHIANGNPSAHIHGKPAELTRLGEPSAEPALLPH